MTPPWQTRRSRDKFFGRASKILTLQPVSGGRHVGFRVLRAIALAFGLLVAMEIGARLLVGPVPIAELHPVPPEMFMNLVERPPAHPDLLVVHQGMGHLQFACHHKTRRRILMFGSSAMHGFTLSMFDAVPWRLERKLQAAGMDVEVLNLAAVGLTLRMQLGLLQKCLNELQPDVVVLFEGNNEGGELCMAKLDLEVCSPREEAVRRVAGRLQLYQLARSALWRLIGWEARTIRQAQFEGHKISVQITDADRERLRSAFRENLRVFAGAVRAAGAQALICTVPTNDLWQPELPEPRDAPSEIEGEGTWRELADHAPTACVNGDIEHFLGRLRKRQAQDDHAFLHFLAGRTLHAAGRTEEAYKELLVAKERDPHPCRTLPSLNEIVREVCQEGEAMLCDVDEQMRRAAPDGILDFSMFMDMCHFTPVAADRAADIIARQLGAQSPERCSKRADLLSLEGWPTMRYFAATSDACDSEIRAFLTKATTERFEHDYPIPDELEFKIRAPMNVFTPRQKAIAGFVMFGARKFTEAAAWLQAARKAGMPSPTWDKDVGLCLLYARQFDGARACFNRFLETNRDPSIARLRDCLSKRGTAR